MAFKVLGIEFANIFNTPLHQRLETLAVLQWVFTFFFLGLTGIIIFLKLLFSSYYYLPLLYVVWLVYDINTCYREGREIKWVKSLKVWWYFKDYFPIKLLKTDDIEPNCNYFFLYHPHGIVSSGAFLNFATEANGISKLFPGLRFRVFTLRLNFYFPLTREYVMSYGFHPATKDCIRYLLNNCGTNNALVIVVGGAAEALEANPGCFNLYLNKRKGFIKLALESGSPLVPVYAYGESDLYTQLTPSSNSIIRKIQNTLTDIFTFSMPLFHGRGIMNYSLGLMPYRKPVNVVVGSPLKVPKIANPTNEEVNEWHKKYVDHLIEHFEKYKMQNGLKESDHLTIL